MKGREFTKMVSDYVWNELDKLSDKELVKVIKKCREFSTTNCSWIEYGLKDILIEVAELKVKDKSLIK